MPSRAPARRLARRKTKTNFPMALSSATALAGRRGALLLRRALPDPSFRSNCVLINALRRRPACLGGFGAGLSDAARAHSSSSSSTSVIAAAAAGGERGGRGGSSGRGGGGGGAFPSWSSPSPSQSPSPSYPRESGGGGGGRGGGRSWSRDGGGGGGGGRGGRGGGGGRFGENNSRDQQQRRRPPPSSSPSSPANLLVSADSVALYGINPVSAALAAGRRVSS